eukprot:CAMPEP_0203983412 /NCGR_PEP_ID=MMETSP0360-20130528/3815_1 /ASSEMBLY_ACC=CAM_ASM_000342 /TAXON_ID=268821 /ORGANISM="Scrippsiella Hangoei, Strain SHTV-5" /LENGTH=32 /DNA_ID= /DNA_START= /DNA_END= /DNA_ORIENTATION=
MEAQVRRAEVLGGCDRRRGGHGEEPERRAGPS